MQLLLERVVSLARQLGQTTFGLTSDAALALNVEALDLETFLANDDVRTG